MNNNKIFFNVKKKKKVLESHSGTQPGLGIGLFYLNSNQFGFSTKCTLRNSPAVFSFFVSTLFHYKLTINPNSDQFPHLILTVSAFSQYYPWAPILLHSVIVFFQLPLPLPTGLYNYQFRSWNKNPKWPGSWWLSKAKLWISNFKDHSPAVFALGWFPLLFQSVWRGKVTFKQPRPLSSRNNCGWRSVLQSPEETEVAHIVLPSTIEKGER